MSRAKSIRAPYEGMDVCWDAAGVMWMTAKAYGKEYGISRQRVSQLAQSGRLGEPRVIGATLLIRGESKKPKSLTIPPHIRRRMAQEAAQEQAPGAP